MPVRAVASAIALLSGAASVSVQMGKDECSCLVWKDVYATGYSGYASGKVDCHDSSGYEYYNELLVQRDLLAIPGATDEVYYGIADIMDWNGGEPSSGKEGRCHNFLEKFGDGFCVNLRFEVPNVTDQWCYVSSKCKDLNGGKTVNDKVSAKICRASEPKPAKTKAEFLALSEKYNLTYDVMYTATTPTWMFLAKNVLSADEFAVFFSKNCDPERDAPYCDRK